MQYCVKMKMTGYFITYVEANSEEEAEDLAIDESYEADFGELKDVDVDYTRVIPAS